MKRTIEIAALVGIVVLTAGCGNSAYKNVSLDRVKVIKTRSGRELVVVEVPYLAFQEVIERSPNVKSVSRVTDLKGERKPSNIAVSPVDDKVVYVAVDTQNGLKLSNLWRIKGDGTGGATRLTAGRYFDSDPAFGPEGNFVYLASNRTSHMPKLWSVRSTGAGGIARITTGNSIDRTPHATPEGKRLFYSSRPINATINQVWAIGVDGSLPTQMLEGHTPRVSPDGTKVFYTVVDEKAGKAGYGSWTSTAPIPRS